MMRRFGKLSFVLILHFILSAFGVSAEGEPEEVTIPGVVEKTINGVTTTDIAGTFFRAQNGSDTHPAIIMFPQMMDMSSQGTIISPRGPMADLAMQFAAQGVHALTVDMSGYFFPGTQSPSMLDGVQDAQAVFNWVQAQPGVDPQQISVLGSSYGANFALMLMAQEAAIKAALLFSPDMFFTELSPDSSALAGRPVLMYAGANEVADPAYLTYLEQFGTVSTPGDGHGLFIFREPDDILAEFDEWMQAVAAEEEMRNAPADFGEDVSQTIAAFREAICAPPAIVLSGGLFLGIRRRRKQAA
jgi:dienelactone hydrolase